MKVVLTRDVKDLGAAGQVKEVSDGYARNYLIPRRMAVPATASALKQVEAREQASARRQAQEEREAEKVAELLKDQPVQIFPKVGEQGRLYGSVTAADIADALSAKLKHTIDRRKIELHEPIRTIGEYKVPYRITRNVTATITLQVERQPTAGSAKS